MMDGRETNLSRCLSVARLALRACVCILLRLPASRALVAHPIHQRVNKRFCNRKPSFLLLLKS